MQEQQLRNIFAVILWMGDWRLSEKSNEKPHLAYLQIIPAFTIPLSSIYIEYKSFKLFRGKQVSSPLCRFIYNQDQLFFISHPWHTSRFESTYKKPFFFKVATFFWCKFSRAYFRIQGKRPIYSKRASYFGNIRFASSTLKSL